MILFQTLTFGIYNNYSTYTTVKTFFFIIEGSITYTGTKEVYKLKYVSLVIYISFSAIGFGIFAYFFNDSDFDYNFIYVLNELNTIFSTFTNFCDYLWYGSGLDKIDIGDKMI